MTSGRSLGGGRLMVALGVVPALLIAAIGTYVGTALQASVVTA